MSDQRMVGHAIRRREGYAASHLGQAEGEAKRSGSYHEPGFVSEAQKSAAFSREWEAMARKSAATSPNVKEGWTTTTGSPITGKKWPPSYEELMRSKSKED